MEKTDDCVGQKFTGYVQNQAKNGYFVHFFNGIHSHFQTDEVYKLGQTLELYVTFLSKKGHIGVSLTPPETEAAVEALNQKHAVTSVKVDDILEVKMVSVEASYAVAKKGAIKVIIRNAHESDFVWKGKRFTSLMNSQKSFK